MKPVIVNLEPDRYSLQAIAQLERFAHYSEDPDDLGKAQVLVTRLGHFIGRDFLEKAPNLKVVATATTGLSHIDLDIMETKCIQLLSLKGETEFLASITATAELTWALIQSSVRPLLGATKHVADGVWNRDLFRGEQLSGKTLGIIGLGRLGRIVGQYGAAFRMKVLATDTEANVYNPDGFEIVPLKELLQQADIVSLHIPSNPLNDHFFDANLLRMQKKGARLINTSRGEVVDESAIVSAISEGQLGFYGTDVLEGEAAKGASFPKLNPIWCFARNSDRIMITPHIGGACDDAMEATELFIAQKIVEFIQSDLS